MNFVERFSKKTQISNFMKNRPVGDESFHVHGRTDRQTDTHTHTTKLAANFSNFANAPKNAVKCICLTSIRFLALLLVAVLDL